VESRLSKHSAKICSRIVLDRDCTSNKLLLSSVSLSVTKALNVYVVVSLSVVLFYIVNTKLEYLLFGRFSNS
jgi:hypothetical protein